jgi:predicted nucleic acid-binding protein
MKVLLDTNVLSEVKRPAPEPKVLAWLDTIDEDRSFISVASIAELRRGIALMAEGRRRAALASWLAVDLPARFAGRVLPIDPAVALRPRRSPMSSCLRPVTPRILCLSA